MKFFSILLPSVLATAACASPVLSRRGGGWGECCLTDAQATYLVESFKNILSNPNRTAAAATAQVIISDDYIEVSDSINSLAGYPLGSETFVGKSVYIEGEEHAPAIPSLQDLLIFHDCQYITWYWLANGIGTGAQEVKGINIFTVSSDCKQIVQDHLEFNSIAWGIDDQQVTNTPPPPPGRR